MKMKLCQVTVGAGCAVTEEEEIWKSAISARGALEERLLLGCNKLIIRNEFREEKRCLLDQVQIRQLERAAITSISGFAKLFPEASKVLNAG